MYELIHDPSGYWRTLERRAPGFLLRKYWVNFKREIMQAPKQFALYAVDLDGDGLAEHVLYRRFEGPGGIKSYFEAQYFDRIDLKTGRMQTIFISRTTDSYTYVRYRGRAYLMHQTKRYYDPHVSILATTTNPRTKRLDDSICDFRGIRDFNEIWKFSLELHIKP